MHDCWPCRRHAEFHIAGGLAAEKVHVVYNGVDLQEFCPRSPTGYLHRELGLPPETPLIGTIGQIGLRKGQDVLLPRRGSPTGSPGAHYVIVGQRHSEKEESRAASSANCTMHRRLHSLGAAHACRGACRKPKGIRHHAHGKLGMAPP